MNNTDAIKYVGTHNKSLMSDIQMERLNKVSEVLEKLVRERPRVNIIIGFGCDSIIYVFIKWDNLCMMTYINSEGILQKTISGDIETYNHLFYNEYELQTENPTTIKFDINNTIYKLNGENELWRCVDNDWWLLSNNKTIINKFNRRNYILRLLKLGECCVTEKIYNEYGINQISKYYYCDSGRHIPKIETNINYLWLGVVDFAEIELGHLVEKAGTHKDTTLGLWVSKYYPNLVAKREKRLSDNNRFHIYYYPVELVKDELSDAVTTFFNEPDPIERLRLDGKYVANK